MRKNVVLAFLFVLVFSCILCSIPGTALADNQGEVIRELQDPNHIFLSVQFSVSSNAHSTGTVYRTTGLKIGIGPYNAFFDQAYLTSKGFYSSSSSNTVDFTAGNIADRSGATVEQIRAAANNIEYGFNLGAQIKVLQNGIVKATIEEKNQVAPVFNQYGLGSCIAAAETRWGWAYDPYKPIALTMQIEGQGSTAPAGSHAPGTVYSYNMHDTVQISALPVGGWKFAHWIDVSEGNVLFSTIPNTSITMNKYKIIKAVFIPDAATPPAVTSPPPEPPAPEPPPPPPPPPNYDPVADFNISNPSPVEGQTIQLRDKSTHPGATNGESIVSWDWTIEDQPGSSEQNVNVTWNEVGTYKITLRVEDQDGDSDSCTKSVVVGPALPAAVITLSSDSIILGREVHIDGDQSTAAVGRSIKWDEMDWKIYNPAGTLAYSSSNRYPLGKGTSNERTLTNNVLNQIGIWTIKLKVKDTDENESEQVTSLLTIYPDQPPIADFWLVSEALRNSYQGYELTVHDQSHPAAPDGALGDEIFQRTWTLYYDANNTGAFTVAGSDSATLTTTSGNDQYPKIRFKKTGRYKLEFTVRERAVVWGTLTNGLSGDTSGKALEEKQVVVINLAPTVAFEIQKKMPVDVQFAADYTVSDNKYNSLQSAQAGFIGALEAGGIDPITGVQRVQAGEVGQNYCVTYNPFFQAYYLEEKALKDTPWVNGVKAQSESIYGWHSPIIFNVDNGTTIDGKLQLEQKLDNGSYYKGYYDQYNTLIGIEKVDKVLNILISRANYDSVISSVVPGNSGGWTYSFSRLLTASDGTIYVVYKAQYGSSAEYYMRKINSDLSLGWNQKFITTTDNEAAIFRFQFTDSNNFIFTTKTGSYNNRQLHLVSVGDNGVKNLGTPQLPTYGDGRVMYEHEAFGFFSANSGRYFIFTLPDRFCLIDKTGIINTQNVPVNFANTGMRRTKGAGLVATYTGNRTIVFYQWAEYGSQQPGEDHGYLYMIDNNTGTISLEQTYTDLWPGQVPKVQQWVNYFFMDGEVTSDGSIGIRANYIHNVDYGPSDIYYSVINPDFSIAWTKQYTSTWTNPNNSNPRREISNQSINNNLFAHNVIETTNDSTKHLASIYKNNGTIFVASGENQLILNNGAFILENAGSYRYYNSEGNLLWQKSISEGSFKSSKVFAGYLVMATTESGKPVTKLLNASTGNIVNNIPHEYLWNDGERLLCYGIKSDGTRDGTFKCFGQKQGLQYLTQAINNHAWDSQKTNFIASIIDGNIYEDYSIANASTISQLKANHLKLAVISPSTGQTKTQGQYIMNQAEGGWWIKTAATMPGPLADLAQKIIAQVNQERGADNIVLVNQKVELTGNYSDPETDPAGTMRWEFNHDPLKLGSYNICNSMGMSSLNGAQLAVPPTAFDKVGTFLVRYRAKDTPVTNAAYLNDPKAGAKWSSSDAYLTVLVHRKPIAAFTLSSTTIIKTENLVITDNSYDPDLVNTDPEGKKGLRNWEWQHRNTTIGEDWKSSAVIPSSFTSKGVYAIRLRVRDAHGAWSDWTDQQLFTVLNNKPIAAFDALPNPVFVNNPCSLIDSSYDPDGDPLVSWEWTIQGIGTLNKVNPNPFPVSWPNIGDYLVTLRVRDSEGIWSDPVSQTVKVINYFVLTLQSVSIQNGRGAAMATPGGNPPGPSGSNRVDAPVFPVNINSSEIGAYNLNQLVTLTAEPVTSGTYFVEWREGDELISSNTTCTIRMTGNRTITAVFKKDPIFIPAVPPKTHVYIVR